MNTCAMKRLFSEQYTSLLVTLTSYVANRKVTCHSLLETSQIFVKRNKLREIAYYLKIKLVYEIEETFVNELQQNY